MAVPRYLDLVVLAFALPVFVGADLPLLAYGCVAVAWTVQRVLQAVLTRRARASQEPRTVAFVAMASMLGRSLIAGAGILAAGIVEREAGLAAAILVVVLFTVYFGMALIMGAPEVPRRPAR